jgi:MFS family permease
MAGAIGSRLGARRAAVGGAAAVVVAMGLMSTLGAGSTDLVIMATLALAGVGMGVAMPPLAASVTVSVDPKDLGIAGAAQQMMIQVGMVFGIQVMQAVQQARAGGAGDVAGYPAGYLTGLGLTVVGVVLASRIVSSTPRPSLDGPAGGPGEALAGFEAAEAVHVL